MRFFILILPFLFGITFAQNSTISSLAQNMKQEPVYGWKEILGKDKQLLRTISKTDSFRYYQNQGLVGEIIKGKVFQFAFCDPEKLILCHYRYRYRFSYCEILIFIPKSEKNYQVYVLGYPGFKLSPEEWQSMTLQKEYGFVCEFDVYLK